MEVIEEGRRLLYNKGSPNMTPWATQVTAKNLDRYVQTQTDTCSTTQTWEAVARRQTGDPHLFNASASKAAHYAHLWALYGLISNELAHGTVHGKQMPKAYTHRLSGDAARIWKLDSWAGPFFEQGILKLLNAYQTSSCFYARLPGEALFMHNHLSKECLGSEPSLMPPFNVHGYGDAKDDLKRLHWLTNWRTAQEILEGDGTIRPCFLDKHPEEEEAHVTYNTMANEGTNVNVRIRKDAHFGAGAAVEPDAAWRSTGWMLVAPGSSWSSLKPTSRSSDASGHKGKPEWEGQSWSPRLKYGANLATIHRWILPAGRKSDPLSPYRSCAED